MLPAQVLGLLGVDTIVASVAAATNEVGVGGGGGGRSIGGAAASGAGSGARQLSRADVEFIKSLAAAASDAIARDQEKLADVMLQVWTWVFSWVGTWMRAVGVDQAQGGGYERVCREGKWCWDERGMWSVK